MRSSALIALILFTVSAAYAQSVFHPAAEVASGIFGSSVGGGNYTFNESLVVADKLGIGWRTRVRSCMSTAVPHFRMPLLSAKQGTVTSHSSSSAMTL